MSLSRPPSTSDRQGFDRRWFAPNLKKVYAPVDAQGVVEAWAEIIADGKVKPGALQITCGRHCYENFVYRDETEAIIDVTGLKGYGVDEAFGIYVDVGLGNWDMYRLLNNVYQRTLPAGSCYSVGLGGHITGGGYGILSRQWGLSIDLLTAVDVVVKVGGRPELITASARENADLFWALRGGGGGNFGIITRYYFGDAAPASQQMFTATFTFDWSDFAGSKGAANFSRLVELYGQRCAAVPAAPVPSFDILHLNHAAAKNIVWAYYGIDVPQAGLTGPDYHAHLTDQLAALRAELSDIAPLTQEPALMNGHPWHGSTAHLQAPPQAQFRHYTFLEGIQNANGSGPNRFGKYKSAYMTKPFTSQMIHALHEGLQSVPEGVDAKDMANSLCQVDSYGGAINRVPSGATAIPQRSSIMKLQYQTYWDNNAPVGFDEATQQGAHLAWINDLYQAVYADTGGVPDPACGTGVVDGCYYNYCDNDLGTYERGDIDTAMQLYFGTNYGRLRRVKGVWNPDDWFNGPQSIPLG